MKENREPFYLLTLYITGASPNSSRAVGNIRSICNKYLPGNHKLNIIDIYQQQGIAKDEQLVALPMLVRQLPLPLKKLIGNLSDTGKVLKSLELGEHSITLNLADE